MGGLFGVFRFEMFRKICHLSVHTHTHTHIQHGNRPTRPWKHSTPFWCRFPYPMRGFCLSLNTQVPSVEHRVGVPHVLSFKIGVIAFSFTPNCCNNKFDQSLTKRRSYVAVIALRMNRSNALLCYATSNLFKDIA